ncbi:MAG: acyl-CoA thioesterase [Bacteroides sp.]|nr:acyl-CoA thioesterase [Prevotella sp.]MCM1408018.1 acyl-CoA thioesterase [Treponema brennaborense]MCM1468994.1 acyl-CoA thioesterase [Bacteroides sp.]
MTNELDPRVLAAEIEFSVEFYEVDSMKIAWHGNYIQYFERARCALLDKIGYDYNQMEQSGFAFPVVDVRVKYIRPLRFKDRVRAKATLAEYENRLRIQFELRNAATGELATTGSVTQMAVCMGTGETCFVCPEIFTKKVESLIRQGGFPQ